MWASLVSRERHRSSIVSKALVITSIVLVIFWSFTCFNTNWWLPLTQVAFCIMLFVFQMPIALWVLLRWFSHVTKPTVETIRAWYYAIIIALGVAYIIGTMADVNQRAQMYNSWTQIVEPSRTIIAMNQDGCYDMQVTISDPLWTLDVNEVTHPYFGRIASPFQTFVYPRPITASDHWTCTIECRGYLQPAIPCEDIVLQTYPNNIARPKSTPSFHVYSSFLWISLVIDMAIASGTAIGYGYYLCNINPNAQISWLYWDWPTNLVYTTSPTTTMGPDGTAVTVLAAQN